MDSGSCLKYNVDNIIMDFKIITFLVVALAIVFLIISEINALRSDMEKKFNIGLVTATDFLIEKNNYERAQISVVQAKYTYLFKSKIIDFYLGKPLK